MTRGEEIRNAIDTIIPILPSEKGRTYEQSLMATGFEEGAKWADANPNKKLVYTKKELLDMEFGFDLNGNISTPQEIEERAKKYINYRKAKWIEKACEWLLKGGYFVNNTETINDFKQAMEE